MTAPDAPDRSTGLKSGALGLLGRETGRLTLFAVTTGLQTWERTRGIRELAVRRAGEVLQIAAHTPLGRLMPQPTMDDRAEEEAERIATEAREAVVATVERARKEVGSRPKATKPTGDKATKTSTATERRSDQPSEAAVEAGAPGAVTDQVEQIAEQLDLDEPTDRTELPIPDFDNVSLGSLRGRLRSLSLEQLVVLREWEQAHAKRLPVITLLDNRIAKVSAERDSDTKSRDAYPAASSASDKETVRPGS
jgi:hypothetical protein